MTRKVEIAPVDPATGAHVVGGTEFDAGRWERKSAYAVIGYTRLSPNGGWVGQRLYTGMMQINGLADCWKVADAFIAGRIHCAADAHLAL